MMFSRAVKVMLCSLASSLTINSVIMMVFIRNVASSDEGLIKDLVFGKQLTNSLTSVLNDVNLDGCVKECMRRPRCLSVNYKRSILLCDLNFIDTSTSGNNLISNPSAVYIEKKYMKKTDKSACSKKGCELHEQCRIDETGEAKCSVSDCGFPPTVTTADYHLSNGIGVYSKVEYTCRNNTCLDGKPYIGCQGNESWSPTRFACRERCSPGWIHFSDSCYLFVGEFKTWHNAQMFCEERKAYLAEITSESENIFVTFALKALFAKGRYRYMWIGGTDEKDENKWLWAHTELPLDSIYSNWNEGEPNNGRKENCLAIGSGWQSEKGKWYDEPCHWNRRFVCERDGCQY